MFIEIGKKIKQLRDAKGISQDFLAKYLNLPIKTLIKIESGEVYPSIEMIPVIADEKGVLGVYGIGVNLDRAAEKLPAIRIQFEEIQNLTEDQTWKK